MKTLLVLLLLIPSLSWGLTFKNGKVVSGNSNGVNNYGGRFELPEDASPNYETLRFFLNNYLNDWDRFYHKWSNEKYKYLVKGYREPYEFQFDLKKMMKLKKKCKRPRY